MKQVAVPAEGTPGTCEAGSPGQAPGPPHPPSGLPELPWSREGWGPWCHTHMDRREQPEGRVSP